ncbi:MAG: serine hydrolase domain-containing protein [Bacillota bacterium]|nr:serine hydrolase domain-containing protein [Bacillota bacterium]
MDATFEGRAVSADRSRAAGDRSAKIDEALSTFAPEQPGIAVAVIRDGEIVHMGGYGCANLEYGIPITPRTVFHVASVSKQFTSACILMLAAEGRLGLDDDVRRHLPEVPGLGAVVTVRHLMHHTSGLRDQWELLRWAGWRLDDVITQEHILKLVHRQRALNFAPGSEYLYSNTGYTLLAEIVARTSGQPLREFAAERIFGPVGMTRTHVHDDHELIVKDRAYSYSPRKGGGFQHSVLSFANCGATSLFTTAEDLARWLLHLETLDGTELGAQMQDRFRLNGGELTSYAAGLRVDEYRGLGRVGHSGSDAGYRSFCARFPAQRYGVVVLANLGTIVPESLAMCIAEIDLGDSMTPSPAEPSAEAAPPVPESVAGALAGRYVVSGLGTMVEVRADGGRLMVKVGEGKETAMVPVGAVPDRFAIPSMKATVVLKAGEPGPAPGPAPAAGFTIKLPGQDLDVRRILPQLPPDRLAEYAGCYYSPELDTEYTIVVRDGMPVVTHRRHEDCGLVSTGADQFEGDRQRAGRMEFARDADGRITGFLHTGSRCRNLRFERRA